MTVVPVPSRPSRALTASLRVRSIDAEFLRALQVRAFHARVHSVFERVINVERATNELFTLAAHGMDNAPLTAIVDSDGFRATGVVIGDPVAAIDDALQIGDGLVLNLAAASIWKATLPRYTTAPARLSDQLRAARSYLALHGVRDGMTAQAGAEGAFALEVATALKQRSTSLLEALGQARHADAYRYAVSMLGLGPGLTPSGDDFLVGLFAVLNVAGSPCHGWLDGGFAVLEHAENATNAISLAALTAAADGRVRESLATLIESLLYGTPETLVQPLRQVLAIGATSGADLVAGILAGLEMNLQVEATRSLEPPLRSAIAPYRSSPAAAVSTTFATGA